MGLRSLGFLLLVPFAYACGTEGDALPDEGDNELPFGMAAPEEDAALGGHLDGGVKPGARTDASTPSWMFEPLDTDSACAASSLAAEQVVVQEEVVVEVKVEKPAPVALYVMFDKSLSMASRLWTPAVAALKQFIQAPASSGVDMAMQYFPSANATCSGSGYSTPAVALGTLPGNASALLGSLDKQSPSGIGTPIEGALRGITEYCKSFQATHPNERCVGVLVTDGKPELDGCEHDDAKLVAIAGKAWTDSKVRTFAVGLQGADFGLLDQIAKAGGAADCDDKTARFSCDVSAGPGLLTAALAKIRETVTTTETHTELQTQVKQRPLECEWRMPAPSADLTVDTGRVNVTLRGASVPPLGLGRVSSAADCQPGAWHFDVPANPTRIIACPQTCEAVKTAGYSDVSILLGCQTNILLL